MRELGRWLREHPARYYALIVCLAVPYFLAYTLVYQPVVRVVVQLALLMGVILSTRAYRRGGRDS